MQARPLTSGFALSTLLLTSAAFAQIGSARPYDYSPVGQLQDVGTVGRSDTDFGFGRVGGAYTGRFDARGARPIQYGGSQNGGAVYQRSPFGEDRRLLSLSQSNQKSMFGLSANALSPHRYRAPRRERLGTFESNRNLTFLTRADRIRAELPDRVRFTGPLNERRREQLESLQTPIMMILDRSNPVPVRSPLGLLTTQFVGRSASDWGELKLDSYTAPPVPDAQSLLNPAVKDDLVHLPDILAAGLDDDAGRYFRLGVAYFSEANYGRAWDAFDICAGLKSQEAQPRTAMVLTAYARKDFHLAAIHLHRAFARTQALDDLKVDVEAFYGSVQAFDRVVHDANLSANRAGAEPSGDAFALLAYFAWLNQDVRTAIASARTAEEHLPGPFQDGVRTFREKLMALP